MKKTKVARPSLAPQKLSRTSWYYEDKNGVDVVAEHRTKTGAYVATTITRIPRSKLMKSAARCGWGKK